MKYEHRNQIDNVPFRISMVKGAATDQQGIAIPKLCIGIFTEAKHDIVATAETDEKGTFELKDLPPSDYRLVAQYPGFCPANVRLRVQPQFRTKKALVLHMKPAAIDSCSYGELAKTKRHGLKPATTTPDPKARTP
jgi:uncharacterized caspase-like protein